MKTETRFNFTIPRTEISNVNGLLKATMIGEYTIEAVYYDKHEYDYNSIKWNDADITRLVLDTEDADELRDMIDAATDEHVSYLISEKYNHDCTND